ncbi:hypothetical protein [Holospora curviuscula]|nr:hypothetical protein [Holospora curviuscula]
MKSFVEYSLEVVGLELLYQFSPFQTQQELDPVLQNALRKRDQVIFLDLMAKQRRTQNYERIQHDREI